MDSRALRFHQRFRPILRFLRSRFARLRWIVTGLCLVIAILATGLFSLSNLHMLGDSLGRLMSVNARLARYLENVQSAGERINTAFVLRLAGDREDAQTLYHSYIATLGDTREGLEEISGQLSKDLRETVAEIVEKLNLLEKHSRNFFNLDGKNSIGEVSIERYAAQLSPYLLGLAESVREAQKLNFAQIVKGGDASQDAVSTGIRLLMLLLIVASLGILYGVYLYACRVFRPVQRLSRSIRQLAESHIETPLPSFSHKDLGTFARPMNLIVSRLERAHKRQQAEFERVHQTLEASMASLIHPLFMLDTHNQVVLLNPAGRNFLDSIGLGDSVSQLPAPLETAVTSVRDGAEDLNPKDLAGAMAFEMNGSERYFVPRITRLVDKKERLFGFTLMLEDVTDLRLIDELRSNLIGVIGHELQTPMTVVRLGLHLLRKNAFEELSKENQEVLQSALEETEILQNTLQNLLDLYRVDVHGIGLKRSRWKAGRDLHASAQRFCRIHQVEPSFFSIDVPPDLPDLILDRERMDHVFINLLGNAHRFNPEGEEVRMSAQRLNDEWVRFSVADKGPGIPQTYQTKVFEPYFRVPGQGPNGAGLGLFIAERIVRMHGGRIHVESKSGEGATFHVDLPLQNQPEPTTENDKPRRPSPEMPNDK